VTITARDVVEDCYVVTARAAFPDGRHDESIGAVPIAGLKGESRSNAMMKAETKAKRRVTLSLVGLSTLDESEVDSIPGAQPVPVSLPAPAPPGAPNPGADAMGASVAPADIPAAWVPFVKVTTVTGRITGGTRNSKSGKTTLDIETGDTGLQQVWTLDKDLAKVATVYKDDKTPVTFTISPTREIVTVAEATDAAF
jgi:hypothetical protein